MNQYKIDSAAGPALWSAVGIFIMATGQPREPHIHRQIFEEVVNQVVTAIRPDPDVFMTFLRNLPSFSVLVYSDHDPDPQVRSALQANVTAYGIDMWFQLRDSVGFKNSVTYQLTVCTDRFVVLREIPTLTESAEYL